MTAATSCGVGVPSNSSRVIAHALAYYSLVPCPVLSSLVSSQLAVPCYTFFGG